MRIPALMVSALTAALPAAAQTPLSAPFEAHKKAVAAAAKRIAPDARPEAATEAAAAAVTPAGGLDWRFAHPSPALLAGFDVAALLNSPFSKLAAAQAAAQAGARGVAAADWDAIHSALSEIDRVAISLKPGSAPDKMDGLILLSGRFEGGALRQLLERAPSQARPRFLGSGTVLLGEDASTRAALARMKRAAAAPAPGSLAAAALALAADSHLWAVGRTADLSRGQANPQARQMAAMVDSFSMGLTLTDSLVVRLALNASSPQAAEQIAAMYALMETQLAHAPGGAAQWEELRQALRMERSGSQVSFLLAADAATLSKSLPQLASLPLGAGIPALTGAADASTPPAAALPPPAPQRNTVIIHGLDDGPREIPLSR